ncbi:MAG: hypothetical protein K8I29_02515 [Alphaproteobacteria bacterium]|uniref:Uncharacterized protein n=1 Tax=Candidatus Nitrobium versatile TaxID=2884831 RepID=A0A953LVP0_9BACT|nr:hypothetical protein [Candidatus Nitrobium versatile]
MKSATLKRYRIPFLVTGIVLALVFLDFFVGYRQDKILEERKAQKKRVERLAWYLERTNIEDIFYTGEGGRYTMKLKYENVRPDEEMWIMVFSIKAFVQVGTLWRELSVNDMRMKRGDYSVERLKDPLTMTVTFDMPFTDYQELMPGYMHMKINNLSYISAEAVAKEDIIEKNEDVFIYVSTEKKKGKVKTLLR